MNECFSQMIVEARTPALDLVFPQPMTNDNYYVSRALYSDFRTNLWFSSSERPSLLPLKKEEPSRETVGGPKHSLAACNNNSHSSLHEILGNRTVGSSQIARTSEHTGFYKGQDLGNAKIRQTVRYTEIGEKRNSDWGDNTTSVREDGGELSAPRQAPFTYKVLMAAHLCLFGRLARLSNSMDARSRNQCRVYQSLLGSELSSSG